MSSDSSDEQCFTEYLDDKFEYHTRNHSTLSSWTANLAGISPQSVFHSIKNVIGNHVNNVDIAIPVFVTADFNGRVMPVTMLYEEDFKILAGLVLGDSNLEINKIYEDPSESKYYIYKITSNLRQYEFYFNDGRQYNPNPGNISLETPMTWHIQYLQGGNPSQGGNPFQGGNPSQEHNPTSLSLPLHAQFIQTTLENLHQRLLRLEQ